MMGVKDVTVRPFENADAKVVAGLVTMLGYPTSTEDMSKRMAHICARDDFATFVADAGGSVVGIVGACVSPFYERDGFYGRVVALAVDERFRGKGIGAQLVRRAETWLAEMNAGRIIVNSGTARRDAHAFYSRLGYETTGVRLVKLLAT